MLDYSVFEPFCRYFSILAELNSGERITRRLSRGEFQFRRNSNNDSLVQPMDRIQKSVLEQINSKKIEGYKYLYDNYFASLCSFSAHFVGNRDEAEDIVQEVIIRIWNGRATFNSLAALTSFLYVSVKNASLNTIRDHSKECHGVDGCNCFAAEDKIVDQLMIEEEFYRHIYAEVNKLTPERRNIILLSIEGFSNQEIAEKTGVSVNTVKTLKLKTYRLLRSAFETIHTFPLFFISLS